MSFLVIAGGVSVNDPQNHDRYPYNFINPAVAKAKALKSNGASAVTLAMFTPSYELRVQNQSKEHKVVTHSRLPCSSAAWGTQTLCSIGAMDPPKDPDHFKKVAKSSATAAKVTFKELRTAAALTSLINGMSSIEGIYYFGHSNKGKLFLEYSAIIADQSSVSWGQTQAATIAKSKFSAGAKFVSYGCNQGDAGGLCQTLSETGNWGIRCIGSQGKTNYTTIGQGHANPTSGGGWVAYTNGTKESGTVDITKE